MGKRLENPRENPQANSDTGGSAIYAEGEKIIRWVGSKVIDIPYFASNGRFISRFVSEDPTICVATCALLLCCQGLRSRVMCPPTLLAAKVDKEDIRSEDFSGY